MDKDEFRGMGGSYVIDEATGLRRRVDAPQVMPVGGGARDPEGNLLFGPEENTENLAGPEDPQPAGTSKINGDLS